MKKLPWVLAFLAVGVAAFLVGRLAWDDSGPRGPDDGDDKKTAPLPPTPTGKEIVVQPLATQPVKVDDSLVRQTLKPGKTYRSLLKGKLDSRGTNKRWGFTTVVDIHYVFEAQIERDIIDNDGEVIVEERRFPDVRSVEIEAELKDIKLELGPAKMPVLAAISFLDPALAITVGQLDGVSGKPVLDFLKLLGIDVFKDTGHKDKAIKILQQYNSLKGKAVRLVYWNKEGRTGIVRMTPLVGQMTDDERLFHHHSALLSDILIFPERKKLAGESWLVRGDAFSNLIDPGLRASTSGEVRMLRLANQKLDGQERIVLEATDGQLNMDSDDKSEGQVGWFKPRGQLFFSPQEQIIVEAALSGKGTLNKVHRNHLLFKTEFKQEPVMSLTYSCTVADTPKREKAAEAPR